MLEDTQGGQWNESEFDFTELLLALLKYNNMPLLPLWVGLDDKNNTRRIIFVRTHSSRCNPSNVFNMDKTGFARLSNKIFSVRVGYCLKDLSANQ